MMKQPNGSSPCYDLTRLYSLLVKITKCHLSKWARSSVGRAPALQAGGRGFEPHCGPQIKNKQGK